jgi:DNA-binding PadR family transcriptional regulator
MAVKLVILGLLRERPLHGYEIKQTIEDHMGDWTSIAFGSIYFALDKLSGEGLVEVAGKEQEGKRPSRNVYRITKAGRSEFIRLLREAWQKEAREFYELDICLFFLPALPSEDVKEYLRGRIQRLEAGLGYLRSHGDEQLNKPDVPRYAKMIFDHTNVHTKAELAWTKEVLHTLEEEK